MSVSIHNLPHSSVEWKPSDFGMLRIRVSGNSRLFRKNANNKFSCSCSANTRNDAFLPSLDQLSDARIIYSVASSMGHNQESHPESHFRVPAIVDALQQMHLTSKFRGSEVIELQNFEPASVDDIASVHARAYVSGLEKAMDQASEKGLIFIDSSGPTYATATTYQESIVAAGAGLALVDSVVISQPGMSISW